MRRTNMQLAVGIATWGLIASLSLTPAIAADSPARLAGASRVDTAVQVAAHAFAGQKPPVVYLASADQAHLVDATTAGKLADGPLLYAPADSASATALGAKLAANPLFSGVKRVVAVGGKASVHEATLQTLAKSVKASQSERLAGADRYETSVAIAKYALSQAKAGNKAYAAMLDKNGQARAVHVCRQWREQPPRRLDGRRHSWRRTDDFDSPGWDTQRGSSAAPHAIEAPKHHWSGRHLRHLGYCLAASRGRGRH